MSEFVVMEEFDSITQLVGNVSDLFQGIWTVIVVLQEVKHAESKHVKGYTHMSMVVKPAQHPDTQMFVVGILLGQLLQHIDFQLGSFSIFLDIFDDLESYVPITLQVATLDHLPEGALAESGNDLVSILQHVAIAVYEVSIFIIFH